MKHSMAVRFTLLAALSALALVAGTAVARQKKPNIVIIWGDDIGQSNVSAYSHGLMGTKPRTSIGSLKRGCALPIVMANKAARRGERRSSPASVAIAPARPKSECRGLPWGCEAGDATIAELLKAHGYATGQFGKNHLATATNTCPPFTGSTSLRRALPPERREEPEAAGLPERPGVPRQVRPSRRAGLQGPTTDDATVDPRFGKVGKQIIKDTGPLTKKRMETVTTISPTGGGLH